MSDMDFRNRHIGASEVSAFLGMHPRLTPWQLYHLKRGALQPDDLSGNERVEWGVRLEPVVLDALRARGHDVEPWTDPPLSRDGFGGHPDGKLFDTFGLCAGIVEIKTVDWLVFRDWDGEPPAHYLIQLQSYMGLAGVSSGVIAVLVGGNQLKLFWYDFRPALFEVMLGHVRAFWQRVEQDDEPAPDFLHDAAAISKLYDDDGSSVDLTGDNLLTDVIHLYIGARARESAAAEEKEAAAAEIKAKLGVASTGICGPFKISFKQQAGTPDRIIDASMIGQTIKGRKGARPLLIKDMTPKEES